MNSLCSSAHPSTPPYLELSATSCELTSCSSVSSLSLSPRIIVSLLFECLWAILVLEHLNLASVAKACNWASQRIECMDNVDCCDSRAIGVLKVDHGFLDDVGAAGSDHIANIFIDWARHSYDASAASKAADGGLCYALEVVSYTLRWRRMVTARPTPLRG